MCIREGDQYKILFNTCFGHFSFEVMPFQLQGVLGSFMNFINYVLKEYLDKGMVVYVDNVLLYSDSMEEHIALVRAVLETLANNSLYNCLNVNFTNRN